MAARAPTEPAVQARKRSADAGPSRPSPTGAAHRRGGGVGATRRRSGGRATQAGGAADGRPGGAPQGSRSRARPQRAPAPAEPKAAAPKSAEPAPKAQPPSATPDMQRRSVAPRAGPAQTDWDVVPVFYGTDRVRKHEAKRLAYTSDRARRLELGRALVTVPKSHQVPNIERPFAIRVPYFNVTLYEQAEDPKQHFTIQELKALTREEFLALVRERASAAATPFKDQAVVFVHGYNTDFDYALYRTAQMAYDLKFDGAAFLYSWPSGGGVASYGYDRESSTQAEPYLREFLELVVKDTGAKSVSVIAHSMGNLPLLRRAARSGPSACRRACGSTRSSSPRPTSTATCSPTSPPTSSSTAAASRSTARPTTGPWRPSRRVAGGIPRAGDVPTDGPLVIAGHRHHRRHPDQHRLPGAQPLELCREQRAAQRHRPAAADGRAPARKAHPHPAEDHHPQGRFLALPAGALDGLAPSRRRTGKGLISLNARGRRLDQRCQGCRSEGSAGPCASCVAGEGAWQRLSGSASTRCRALPVRTHRSRGARLCSWRSAAVAMPSKRWARAR